MGDGQGFESLQARQVTWSTVITAAVREGLSPDPRGAAEEFSRVFSIFSLEFLFLRWA